MAESPKRPRSPADGPWCWQSKPVLRKIREAFDASHNVPTALAVYGALCEIASDEQSETFTTTHAYIQSKSGVSVRTIQNHLGIFSELSLVRVSTPKLRAPSTYTLLAFGSDCATFGNHNASKRNDCATFGNGPFRAPLPTLEESQKKSEESEEKKKKKKEAVIAPPELPTDKTHSATPKRRKPSAWREAQEMRERLSTDKPLCDAWSAYVKRRWLFVNANLYLLRDAIRRVTEMLESGRRNDVLAWLSDTADVRAL